MNDKNGWYKVCGYDVYMENDKILRGVSRGCTTYPYRWDCKSGCYIACYGISVSAFRSGYYRNRIIIA